MADDWKVGEEWRAVPNSKGYEVSNLGRVRRGERMLKPCLYSTGYHVVVVYYNDGTNRRRFVHALVCEAFIGPVQRGQQCCHGNGDKRDNRVVNLRYGSAAENMSDQFRHGTRIRGDNHPCAKLSYDLADGIRTLRAGGESLRSLAKKYGVDKKAVQNLLAGKTWVRPAPEHASFLIDLRCPAHDLEEG